MKPILPLFFGLLCLNSCLLAQPLYFASNNVVYCTSGKELPILSGRSLIPLTVSDYPSNDPRVICISSKDNIVQEIALPTIRSPKSAKISNILIADQKLYIPAANPTLFKIYPTFDTTNVNPLAVTTIPHRGKICTVYMPRDETSFPGGFCTITDIRTGKDLKTFKVEDLDASLVKNLTWISDRYVIFGLYSYRRENSFVIIDIKNKCFLKTKITDGMRYFSKSGAQIIGYFGDQNGKLLSRVLKIN